MEQIENLKERIREVLSQYERQVILDRRLMPAAVLVPLFYKEEQYYTLFTRRTEQVEHHKGQISFPGGACDAEDKDYLATALRETFEEIGVRPEEVEVVGALDDIVTLSGFRVSPFVGFIPYPYPFHINPLETAEILEVPLAALLDRRRFREERVFLEGKIVPQYFWEYNGNTIWGATAQIEKRFLDLVFVAW